MVEDNVVVEPRQLAENEEVVLGVANAGADVAGDPQVADDGVVDAAAVNVDAEDVPEDEEVGAAVVGDPDVQIVVKAEDANGLVEVVEDCGEVDGYGIADVGVEIDVLVVVDAGDGVDWEIEVEMEDDVEVEHVDVCADMNGHVIVDAREIIEVPDSSLSNSSSGVRPVTTPSNSAGNVRSSCARNDGNTRQSLSSPRCSN